MRKIGILGGMMDPVHVGHLHSARAALEAGLDQVLLAPCEAPPHRPAPLAPAQARLEMCALAAETDARLAASAVELREGPCYAVETVRLLKEENPDAEIAWVLGADKLPTLARWRGAETLFSLCTFYVCPRPGADAHLPVPGAKLRVLDAAPMAVSSGEIIARLQRLDDAEGLLPAAVSRYIALNGLYRPDRAAELRARGMQDRRLQHTLGVRETAVRLAELHGARMQAASEAAMLHDIAKPLTLAQMQALAERYGLGLSQEVMADVNLLHGPVGAAIARRELGVTDEEVLSAIACHTTGKPGMSVLEEVIFLADAIEPNRRPYPGLDTLRALAGRDLDAAVLHAMQRTREYVLSQGRHFSPQTERAMQALIAKKGGKNHG
ncbi:MAG: bis(5'-nucleosyl)-tetraphosphatase (symmetrical) YqeK [Clostridia bacterium]|nr:bis(5'-nucleosyl)-tetraphosphatase (symmetrical) YqeK [Clostridia bacterium]